MESIELTDADDMKAKAHIKVLKRYQLHRDAYAVVRQEGLLGSKYLEVVPGDPLLPALSEGESLGKPGKPPVNVDELLQQFKVIATNVEEITGSLKDVVGASEKQELKSMFANFNTTAKNLATFSETLERTLSNNEQNLSMIMTDFKDFAHQMREGWPTMQGGIERISNSVEDAALQARDSLRSIGSVADKINEGKGLLGKLITEEDAYQDLKVAVQGLKNYFAKVEKIGVVFDAHSESMWGVAEHFKDTLDYHLDKRDAKGYFGVRVHAAEDRFYIVQAVSSRKGWTERYATTNRYGNNQDVIPMLYPHPLFVDPNITPTIITFQKPAYEETTIQHRDGKLKFNLQFAKCYKDLAFRFGLFESTAGIAVDYDIPFRNDKFRWVTSMEAYDFYGDDRINDQRPHLKWLNRLFILKNFYMTFGADDFISRHNANAFFGFGLRFADDDLKYLASKFGSLASTSVY